MGSKLFPAIEPYNTGMLNVSALHEIYFEECGNPQGKPVVFLHGGPGGGCSSDARRFFDPQKYRIVLFDQRGCGKSKPHACLEENTTWDLVADIEKLRQQLNIKQWLVFGGSWGSTLALTYAQTHPEAVTELILRGIFLLREREIRWFYQYGASQIFPDAWEKYVEPIPLTQRNDMLSAYYDILTGDDKEKRLAAAQAWSVWEASTSFLQPREQHIQHHEAAEVALAMARIECHYFVNLGFFEHENQLLENINKIRHIPAVIVQGRYDVVCPAVTAWELHKAWPEADFHMIANAGHSAFDDGITAALIEVTNRFA